MSDERWRRISEFPNYEISNYGRVYNLRKNGMMRTSRTNHGHSKITLTKEDGSRHTRSVALLVAEAFVPQPNELCDYLVVLDGDFNNVHSLNLAWRPRWFAWKYTRQLKTFQPIYYNNLAVRNIIDGSEYDSIVQAGITEGLLFEDIWRSTYTKDALFPTGSVFEVIERV